MMFKMLKVHATKIAVGITFLVVILILTAIFGYYHFFRQHNSALLEAIPADAVFVLQINNQEHFHKNLPYISPYLNDMLFFDAYLGCYSFIDKVSYRKSSESNMKSIVSGHQLDEQYALLYVTNMNHVIFKELLKKIQIDSRNYIPYGKEKIYTYGTHYKKFYFVNHHDIFAVSENLQLLKNSIEQHRHLQHIDNQSDFKAMYHIVQKNQKQNWLLLNHDTFLPLLSANFSPTYREKVLAFQQLQRWSAYQIFFTESEIQLSGYLFPTDSFVLPLPQYNSPLSIPSELIPFGANCLQAINGNRPYLYFSLSQDSNNVSYLMFKSDSTFADVEDLLADSLSVDSFMNYKNFKIYQADKSKTEQITLEKNSTLNYFLYDKSHFILADSVSTLKFYINQWSASQSLAEFPLFRFAQINLPTSFARAHVYFFQNEQYKQHFFAQDKHLSNTYKQLMLLGYTFDTMNNGIVSTKIYLKFQP